MFINRVFVTNNGPIRSSGRAYGSNGNDANGMQKPFSKLVSWISKSLVVKRESHWTHFCAFYWIIFFSFVLTLRRVIFCSPKALSSQQPVLLGLLLWSIGCKIDIFRKWLTMVTHKRHTNFCHQWHQHKTRLLPLFVVCHAQLVTKWCRKN